MNFRNKANSLFGRNPLNPKKQIRISLFVSFRRRTFMNPEVSIDSSIVLHVGEDEWIGSR